METERAETQNKSSSHRQRLNEIFYKLHPFSRLQGEATWAPPVCTTGDLQPPVSITPTETSLQQHSAHRAHPLTAYVATRAYISKELLFNVSVVTNILPGYFTTPCSSSSRIGYKFLPCQTRALTLDRAKMHRERLRYELTAGTGKQLAAVQPTCEWTTPLSVTASDASVLPQLWDSSQVAVTAFSWLFTSLLSTAGANRSLRNVGPFSPPCETGASMPEKDLPAGVGAPLRCGRARPRFPAWRMLIPRREGHV